MREGLLPLQEISCPVDLSNRRSSPLFQPGAGDQVKQRAKGLAVHGGIFDAGSPGSPQGPLGNAAEGASIALNAIASEPEEQQRLTQQA